MAAAPGDDIHQQLATLLSKESVVQMRGHPERANTTEAQRGISSRELAPQTSTHTLWPLASRASPSGIWLALCSKRAR